MSADDLREARRDVDAAIIVWREIIEERLGNRIEYAVMKGSATKPWETQADYVPVISDLDIHIGTLGGQTLFPQTREGFNYALDTTRAIEERFLQLRPCHLHIPRPQVVLIKEELKDILPESTSEVIPLYGETPLKPTEPVEHLRDKDLAELHNLGPLLDRLPEQVIDRIDLEYYRVLRMLCYVVSPTPIRILSQSHPDPKQLWSLNRTNIIRLLKENGYNELARSYGDYYAAGWRAFHCSFRDNEVMRLLLSNAYDVLFLSHKLVEAML